ncbi:right-handed parallel beta-helix repeat-containing protein [Phenylobacterium sp.]|uniref:right-handed parallel beta-helix repeat-containing protein n=1 Tax=Phenylobacterium sp. TaxID=1871053 RepID=UPI00273161C4|nr:right-handed parallel beta-helix repeat-containing protein [Phenylobacterium sp.]MDP1598227.1 right-handed parallel beta-helix repeat-containing protein [Phenylobacterium sp.]MDP3594709.1 right-handed parallel beta-helix repeat-containing protein [Phenylobacterium sp.]
MKQTRVPITAWPIQSAGLIVVACVVAALLGGSQRSPHKAVLAVGDVASLNSALSAAHDGDTILLKSGVYSGVRASNLSFDQNVTIRSENPKARAQLTNFAIRKSKGLTFEDLEFAAQGPSYESFIAVDSSALEFRRIFVHGSLDGDTSNDGQGIGILRGRNIRIVDSEFRQLHRAVSMSQSESIFVIGNVFQDLRTTGVVGAEVMHVEISDNDFSSFHPQTADHPDAVQFLTAGTSQTTRNIVVRNNLIHRGEGKATQGIFFRDQVGTLPYQDVVIQGNHIIGTGYGALYVIGARNLHVSDNVLVSNPGKENRTWMIIKNVDGGLVADNQAISITFENVENLKQERNRLNKPANDEGRAALKAWEAARR